MTHNEPHWPDSMRVRGETQPVTDAYLRLSDLRADDLNEAGASNNLLDGERLLRDFIVHRLGWRVGEVIVENDLTEEGKPKPASAYKRRKVRRPDGTTKLRVIRPGFRRLLARLDSRQSQAFVTIDLDRAMRDPRDLEDLIDVVEERQANVRSLTGSLQFTDGGTDAEITLARVLVAFANKASRDTSRRVAAARLRLARAGASDPGGLRAYGWTADGLTAEPAEREVVAQASHAVLAGLSLRAIAYDLRQRRIPTVTGAEWSPQGNLRYLLLRPRNAGLVLHQGEELEGVVGNWEPLIDLDTYRAVVAKLRNPDRESVKGGRAPRWLGSGIYRCVCGGTMGGASGSSRRGKAAIYLCRDQAQGKPGPHTQRNLVQLDRYVSKVVVKRLNMPDAASLIAPPGTSATVDAAALRREAGVIRTRMLQDADDEAADRITREQLHRRTRQFRQRLDAIDRQLSAAVQVSPLDGLIGITEDEWHALPLGTRRAALARLLDVALLPVRPGRRSFDPSGVKITFKDGGQH